mmetsp:Transcript_22745/g.63500  ORF Transcript_22745/g.63500 Transcript_22745/m.63500 type:complete len:310 (+) Transcript_22745:235-1164(+)
MEEERVVRRITGSKEAMRLGLSRQAGGIFFPLPDLVLRRTNVCDPVVMQSLHRPAETPRPMGHVCDHAINDVLLDTLFERAIVVVQEEMFDAGFQPVVFNPLPQLVLATSQSIHWLAADCNLPAPFRLRFRAEAKLHRPPLDFRRRIARYERHAQCRPCDVDSRWDRTPNDRLGAIVVQDCGRNWFLGRRLKVTLPTKQGHVREREARHRIHKWHTTLVARGRHEESQLQELADNRGPEQEGVDGSTRQWESLYSPALGTTRCESSAREAGVQRTPRGVARSYAGLWQQTLSHIRFVVSPGASAAHIAQ